MAIVTIPTVSKGQQNILTLDKSELALHSKVVASSYFSNQDNWKIINIIYNTPSGQRIDVLFDATLVSPTGNFEPTLKSQDTWEVENIYIQDYDKGTLRIDRDELTTSEFDIELGSGGTSSFTWTSGGAGTYSSTQNSITRTSTSNWDLNIISNEAILGSGDGYVEWTIATGTNAGGLDYLGGLQVGPTPYSGANSWTALNFGIYLDSGSTIRIYESGTNKGTVGTAIDGDVLRVAVELGVVKYYQNGTLLYSSLVAPTYPLHFGFSPYDEATVENISIG